MKALRNSPTISVLALDSQAYPLHPKTLYSLFTQQMDDWELFIIADGLSDPIEEITRRTNDSRITILSGDTSHMFELWNNALRQSSGDFITYLSSGIVYFPTHFQTLLKSLVDHDDLILTYADSEPPGNYQFHPGKMMHRKIDDLVLDQTHEDPLMVYWQMLHQKGSFGQIKNKTWEYALDYDQQTLPTLFPAQLPLKN